MDRTEVRAGDAYLQNAAPAADDQGADVHLWRDRHPMERRQHQGALVPRSVNGRETTMEEATYQGP